MNLGCFTCLSCGKVNPIKGHSYTNKYCNNSCQQQHRSRLLIKEWKDNESRVAWRQVPEYIKKYLIEKRGHKCEDCGLEEWKTEKIPLELEHIDGDNRNNIKSNLKLLCCNCHALTGTWRGRNINSGKVKVSDDELLTALKECSNIRQALMRVGLTPKGGNYDRAKKLNATLVK